jgi:hypothetical protein
VTAVAAEPAPEETLAWENAQRKRAGGAGTVAGLLLLASTIYGLARLSDAPKVTLTDGLRDVLGQPPARGPRGLLTETAMFLDDHKVDVIVTSIASAIGTALIAIVLGFLFRATQARNPALSRMAIYAALIGPVLFAIGPLLSGIGLVTDASSYVSKGVFSTLGAHDALRTGGLLGVGGLLAVLGQLLTALAFVLISLNAMRVGLLTRFLGILGVVSGALVIFPVGGTPIIVECFWLAFVGMMILGRGRAAPPAWHTGRAEPWLSQQQLREQREGPGGDDVAGTAPPSRADEDTDVLTAPAAAKRKRKRR